MALGAQRRQILRFFLIQGVRWAAIGGCVGIAAALMLVRFMRSMLFEISAYDPMVLLAVATVLSVVVLLASSLPAFRATQVDPLIALKSE